MAEFPRSRASRLAILGGAAVAAGAMLSWIPARKPPQTGPIEPPTVEDVRSTPATPTEIDEAFAAFWAAENPDAAAARTAAIVATGVTFDDALARLRKGRSYAADVPRGRKDFTHKIAVGRGAGVSHPYTIVAPDDYDPARSYPVRFQLHGGVGRELSGEFGTAGDQVTRIPGSFPQIYVLPNAWDQSMWWEESQGKNIPAILDRVKRMYNVDENRVYMSGISDGATGSYFFAFREPTPFASFLPLNGQMLVLSNGDVRPDGDMFVNNATNRPFFAVSGGKDPLYPAESVRPFVEHMRELGTEVVYHVHEDAGHNTQWWPEEKDAYDAFVQSHPRRPLPDHLSWETERVDRYNRIDWLVIDELGHTKGETPFSDTNVVDFRGRNYEIFPHASLTGHVELTRKGNTVEASTNGVRRFTLLLSPDQFDFAQPVVVKVNGSTVLEQRLTPSVGTLLEWSARDNDRTALYGAAVQIVVPGA